MDEKNKRALLKLLRKRIPTAQANCTRCGVDLFQPGEMQVIKESDLKECLCSRCHNSDMAQKDNPH